MELCFSLETDTGLPQVVCTLDGEMMGPFKYIDIHVTSSELTPRIKVGVPEAPEAWKQNQARQLRCLENFSSILTVEQDNELVDLEPGETWADHNNVAYEILALSLNEMTRETDVVMFDTANKIVRNTSLCSFSGLVNGQPKYRMVSSSQHDLLTELRNPKLLPDLSLDDDDELEAAPFSRSREVLEAFVDSAASF